MNRLSDFCPNAANHGDQGQPESYVDSHEWAEAKMRTHEQSRCPGCNLYRIWTPKPKIPTRALSLWQPYATAIAVGAKRYETRPYPTSWRGRVLICSTASTPDLTFRVARRWLDEWFAQHYLFGPRTYDHGVVVAVADVVSCEPAFSIRAALYAADAGSIDAVTELRLGDFGQGRFAWGLKNVRALPKPLPVKGRQRLWRPSAELVAAVDEQLGTPTETAAREEGPA